MRNIYGKSQKKVSEHAEAFKLGKYYDRSKLENNKSKKKVKNT